jgi:predicted Zn-dependent peptidase
MEMQITETRNICKQVLPNGLTVISERMEHVRSISVGIWLNAGSRQETPERNGISHFIEHMVFKGTETRTAEDIARSVDSIGGHLDAFTAKECVSFNTVVLDEHLDIAFDVLSDLVLHPRFDPDDIDKERSVIMEEIKAEEDNPDYLLHELFSRNFWKGHAIGKPILGTKETIGPLQRSTIEDQFQLSYRPNNILIAAAGNVEHDRLFNLVNDRFHQMVRGDGVISGPPPQTYAHITARHKPSLEQVHVCMGLPSYPLPDERRYPSYVLNTLLGGGMSSRLFQNIREKQGLAYSVFSDLNTYRDTGCMLVYAATSPDSAQRVVESIMHELRDVKENSVSAEELRRAKDHLKGSMMLGLESTGSRMSNLSRQELYFGKFFTLDEMIAKIESVSADDIAAITNEFFRGELISLTVLGRVDELKFTRDMLHC